jgi:2-polyprenyl-3-methyl-5-hydroxy-6-metoxy-1,4-benzoquinol methylase
MIKHVKYILLISSFLALATFRLQAQENITDDNRANQYMNQINIESLVNAFDSPQRASWQRPEEVISLFGDVSHQKIMDLGAGSGYFSLRLAAKGASVIAADVNEGFQEVIKEKLENGDFPDLKDRIELRKIEFNDPGLDREEVDGILIVNTWHHVENRSAYIQKALAGVRKGGKIIIVDYKLGVAGGPPERHKLGLDDAVGELKDLKDTDIKIDTALLDRQYIILISK